MSDLREAAEMALEALEQTPTANKLFDSESYEKQKDAIDALRQALAQPVDAVNISQERVDETDKDQHEPVAWITDGGKGDLGWRKTTEKDIPLYTAPPKREWVGLTDEEMEDLWDRYAHMEMMRAIEAKLKEKNG